VVSARGDCADERLRRRADESGCRLLLGKGRHKAAECVAGADSRRGEGVKDEEDRAVFEGREEAHAAQKAEHEAAGFAEGEDVVCAEGVVEDAGRGGGVCSFVAVGESEGGEVGEVGGEDGRDRGKGMSTSNLCRNFSYVVALGNSGFGKSLGKRWKLI